MPAQHQLIKQLHHLRVARFPAGEIGQPDQSLLGGQEAVYALLVATAAGAQQAAA